MSINPKFFLPAVLALTFVSLVALAGVSYQQFRNIEKASISVDDRLVENINTANSQNRNNSYSIQTIRSAGLFAVKKKPKKKTIKAKKTQLKLKLDGIIAAQQTEMSRAVIRSNNKKSLAYGVGDKIEGTNARLHSVEALRVLIDRAGVIESLELERKKIDL